MTNKDLRHKIFLLIEQTGTTPHALAAKIGLANSTILSKWLNGITRKLGEENHRLVDDYVSNNQIHDDVSNKLIQRLEGEVRDLKTLIAHYEKEIDRLHATLRAFGRSTPIARGVSPAPTDNSPASRHGRILINQ